jgi:site-specific DNA-methyltransferase (adenine-specific)
MRKGVFYMSNPNTLYYGDNLTILRNREYFPNECVDLIYLDPPFNSNRNYNVLFKDESGKDADAQIKAFDDTWHWGIEAQETYEELCVNASDKVSKTIQALYMLVGTNQMMAYLVMMTARLVQLHRVLKSTGSLYLHCDPTASHYLKIVLDAIFGAEQFRNEIVWQRTSSHNDSKKWGAVHDTLFYYTKSKKFTWNATFTGHTQRYIDNFYRHQDERGQYRLDHIIRSVSMGPRPNLSYEYKGYTPAWGWRMVREKLEELDKDGRLYWSKTGRPYLKRYLEEQKGSSIKSVITDIAPIGAQSAERLGYPTQKPLSLLERIISASSNPGDVVLDPFCGCGTAIAASQNLDRRWIGIDITHLSIALQKYRLRDSFPDAVYTVIGEPKDVGSAKQLASDDRYQFQWWALSLVEARPLGGSEGSRKGKKGSDKGIDGVINFFDSQKARDLTQQVLIQVKSGKVKSGDIRDLIGTVEREKASIGVFITLEPPTQDMKAEALTAGVYRSSWGEHRKIQILTIEELLNGARIDMPPQFGTFKQANKVNQNDMVQKGLLE